VVKIDSKTNLDQTPKEPTTNQKKKTEKWADYQSKIENGRKTSQKLKKAENWPRANNGQKN
jgi:hypothetical protein